MRRLALAALPLLLAAGLAAATPPIAAGLDAPVAAIPHPDGPLMLRVLARDTDAADRAAAVGELFAMAEAGSGLATYRVATLHRLGDRIGVGVFPRDLDRARSWLLACLPRERCPVEALGALAEIAHARGEATEAMAWTQLYGEGLRRAGRLPPGAAGHLPGLIVRVRAADRRGTRERAWRPAVDALIAAHGPGIEAVMVAAAAPADAGDDAWSARLQRPGDGGRIGHGQLPRGARELHLLCAPREGGEVDARVLVDAFPEPTPGLDAEALFSGARLEVQGEPPAGKPACVLVPVEISDGQLRMRG
jgi:hypothetical protein